MLYAVTYEIEGICGPGGSVDTSQMAIIGFAKSMAETALHQLDTSVLFGEWYNLKGEEADPRNLILSEDVNEIKNIIGQISDTMKSDRLGYIDLWEYEDIFQLIEDQDVISWCSTLLKDRIVNVRKAYYGLVQELADEWLVE